MPGNLSGALNPQMEAMVGNKSIELARFLDRFGSMTSGKKKKMGVRIPNSYGDPLDFGA
jgi:hypothetical protein